MSENSSEMKKHDLVQRLAEVNHDLDSLSPSLAPEDYLRRSKELEVQKKELELALSKKKKGDKVEVNYNPDTDVDPFFKDYDVSIELQSKDPHKKKKAFKMLSAFSILFIIIAVLVLLSWILHWSGVTWNDKTNAKPGEKGIPTVIQGLGIFDVFYSVFEGFKAKVEVIVFVLIIGAFITVVMASKALDGFAQGVTRKLKGKEIYALIPLMLFFSLCGTVEGFAEESLGFYLFLIPIMLMCGFDVFTGVLAIMLGAGVGVLTSVVNPFLVSVAVDNINTGLQGMQGWDQVKAQMGNGIVWRIITWLVFTAVAIAIVMTYAKTVQNKPHKSITFDTYEGDKTFFLGEDNETIKMDWRRKLTLVVFFLTFLIMIVYLIDWDALTGTSVMKDAGEAVNNKGWFITHLIPGFGLGSLMVPASFFLISAIVCGLINGLNEQGFIKLFMNGAADMLSVCLIIGVAGGVTVVLQQSHEQDLFVQGLASLNNMGDIAKLIVFFLIFIPLSFLIPSSTGFATAIFPLLSGVVTTTTNGTVSLDVAASTGMIQAFSFAAGLVNLISPTSGVVMGAVGIARMDYKQYLKGMMPIVGIFFVLSIAFLAIGGALAPIPALNNLF